LVGALRATIILQILGPPGTNAQRAHSGVLAAVGSHQPNAAVQLQMRRRGWWLVPLHQGGFDVPTTNRRSVAVATSIPPRLSRRNAGQSIGEAYQRLCVRSWLDCGFRILSVNDLEEIECLVKCYPEVTFVPTSRNASAWTGRKNPFIADLLGALLDAPEPVTGIINSDLVFEPSLAWQRLPELVRDTIVIGQRYDTTSLLSGTFRRYYPGIDFFFFDRSLAEKLIPDATPFAMGLPWWDYWFPFAASCHRRQILAIDRPGIVHLIHKQAYLDQPWRDFAIIFAKFVVREAERDENAISRSFSSIVPICREVATLPDATCLKRREHELKISQLATFCIPRFRDKVANLDTMDQPGSVPVRGANGGQSDTSSSKNLTPAAVFHRFEVRLAAGEALEEAKALDRSGKPALSLPKFLTAMDVTPDDFDLQLDFAEFLMRCGNTGRALTLLSRALLQEPESTRALNAMGVALHARRRYQEASACFRKILNGEPSFQGAYTNLAVVLCEMDRRQEALSLLERVIVQGSEFEYAAELYRRIASDMPRSREPQVCASGKTRYPS
jgi:tetratricopeptide repeat protein